jgi:hypothetical protein
MLYNIDGPNARQGTDRQGAARRLCALGQRRLMREVERLTYVDGRPRVEKGNEYYIYTRSNRISSLGVRPASDRKNKI